MSNRHKLWTLVREVKYFECYLMRYRHESNLRAKVITCFLLLTSLSGVASFFSNFPKTVWGFVVFASCVLSAVNQHLPFHDRAKKIDLFMPEYNQFINRVLYVWDTKNNDPDNLIADVIFQLRTEKTALENKYLGNDFPLKRKLFLQAESEADDYMEYALKCKEGESENVKWEENQSA